LLRLAAVALLALGLCSCSRGADDARPACVEPSPERSAAPASSANANALDDDVVAFLSAARALHHSANVEEEEGRLEAAEAAMMRLVALPAPSRAAPEVDEVLADAFARLADLRLRRGARREARDAIARGLEHAAAPTYFRGHLIELRGVVEEEEARALGDAGQNAEATSARRRALTDFEEAVRIQEGVIRAHLPADAGGTGH
jgi:tetratricopeptide (TPR) repeat protein